MMLPIRHNAIKWIVGLFAFILLFWLVFADQLIKRSIEKSTEALVGAKVNITDVDISLLPLSLVVTGMSVADAQRPMNNIFEFDQALFSIDPYKLLLGHIVIDELKVDKLQLATMRSDSGTLKQASPKLITVVDHVENSIKKDKTVSNKPDKKLFTFPSINVVLDKEMGLTHKKLSVLDQTYNKETVKINSLRSTLPTEDDIKNLVSQFDKIANSKPGSLNEFQKLKVELESLQQQSNRMKNDVTAAIKQIDRSKKTISEKMNDVTLASQNDYQNILNKYNPKNSPVGKVSDLLFSDKSKKWLDETIYWYSKLEPLLEGDSSPPKNKISGHYYHFPVAEPLPRFLVRKVNFEYVQNESSLIGRIDNISSNQKIFGHPITMKVSSNDFFGMTDFNINGVFEHTGKKQAEDKVSFKGQGLAIHDVQLSKKPLPLSLTSNNVLIDGAIVINQGTIDSHINARFNHADFSTSTQNQRSELLYALNKIKTFTVSANIDGIWFKPSIGLESDIDKKLGYMISELINKKRLQFERELKAGINDNLSVSFSNTNEYLNTLKKEKQKYDADMLTLKNTAMIKLKKSIKADADKLLKDFTSQFN